MRSFDGRSRQAGRGSKACGGTKGSGALRRYPVEVADTATIFGITTLVIFVGFLGSLLFEKTRVPDILILIALGVLIGPVAGILTAAELQGITPIFGALALTLILFEGGLELRVHEVVRQFGSVILLIAISFVATTFLVAFAYWIFVPTSPLTLGLALGALLSAVSAPIVIPLLAIMNVRSKTKAFLNLESALTDAAAIIVFFALLGAIGPSAGAPRDVVAGVLATLLFSTVVAILLGIAWLELLRFLRGRAYSYMITLAVVLGLYYAAESLGGAGPVAALVFGIVLSNGKEISRFLPIKTDFVLDDRIRHFHSEVTFFLKTFFFVSVGILFTLTRLGTTLILLSLLVLGIILFARALAIRFLVALKPEEREDQDVLLVMMPRGLTSVVLATILATTVLSGASLLVDVAFTVVILTNVILTAGVFLVEKRRLRTTEIPREELEVAYWFRNMDEALREGEK